MKQRNHKLPKRVLMGVLSAVMIFTSINLPAMTTTVQAAPENESVVSGSYDGSVDDADTALSPVAVGNLEEGNQTPDAADTEHAEISEGGYRNP